MKTYSAERSISRYGRLARTTARLTEARRRQMEQSCLWFCATATNHANAVAGWLCSPDKELPRITVALQEMWRQNPNFSSLLPHSTRVPVDLRCFIMENAGTRRSDSDNCAESMAPAQRELVRAVPSASWTLQLVPSVKSLHVINSIPAASVREPRARRAGPPEMNEISITLVPRRSQPSVKRSMVNTYLSRLENNHDPTKPGFGLPASSNSDPLRVLERSQPSVKRSMVYTYLSRLENNHDPTKPGFGLPASSNSDPLRVLECPGQRQHYARGLTGEVTDSENMKYGLMYELRSPDATLEELELAETDLRKVADKIFQELDEDGDGNLQCREFVDGLTRMPYLFRMADGRPIMQ
ncbi:hypothetical protein Bbelb_356620 [Branchiostoma belcheri]|nr:hypothetical protein Bbelb_356620 [Branchiostoma belcheri]